MARATPGRALYYKALKQAGVTFDKHYREYTEEELRVAYDQMVEAGAIEAQTEVFVQEPTEAAPPPFIEHASEISELQQQISQLTSLVAQMASASAQAPQHQESLTPRAPEPALPRTLPDPDEHAGVTLNVAPGEPIKTDEAGRVWYQTEVRKPAFPKPRGRRVLRTLDPGVTTETIRVGEYTETFEVPGDPANARPMEVKVTLPSYQTGIYKEPGLPFKIHTYNGVRGFDYDDVNSYYGHPDLVPSEIKKMYVSSDLCYDITTTIRAIENEYRERVLKTEALR